MSTALEHRPMDSEHLDALLSVSGTEKDGEWLVLKDDRTVTLHSAESGVGLNISKIRKLRSQGALLFAENVHGDVFVLRRESLFAGSIDPASQSSRTAGFR